MVTQENQTTEERAFLVGIADHPEQYGVRLVYADWLAEHGRFDEEETQRAIAKQMREAGYGWIRAKGEPFLCGTLIVLSDSICLYEKCTAKSGIEPDRLIGYEKSGAWLRKEIIP